MAVEAQETLHGDEKTPGKMCQRGRPNRQTQETRAGVLDGTLITAMGLLNAVDAQQDLWKAKLIR